MVYEVRVGGDWSEVAPGWGETLRQAAPGPFQTASMFAAWSRTLGAQPGARPVWVDVRRGGVPVMLLPFVATRRGRSREIGFADLGVSDNNAPVFGPGYDPSDWPALRKAAFAALPRADILRLEKMPRMAGRHLNPFAVEPGVAPSRVVAHPLRIDSGFEAYDRTRSKHMRKEQARLWRVFVRHPDARFERIVDPAAAERAMDALDRLQAERMAALGEGYLLGRPAYRAFYRRLVEEGLPSGEASLSALMSTDQVVAVLLAVISGGRVSLVRVAFAQGEWRNCSPGRLVIDKTLEALSAEGFQDFDFSIGDYPYKFAFGIGTEPLYDLVRPLSAWGWPAAAADAARRRLSRSPAARRIRDRLFGAARPASAPAKAVEAAE